VNRIRGRGPESLRSWKVSFLAGAGGLSLVQKGKGGAKAYGRGIWGRRLEGASGDRRWMSKAKPGEEEAPK